MQFTIKPQEKYRNRIRQALVALALFYTVSTVVWGALSLVIFGVESPFMAILTTFGWPLQGPLDGFDIGTMLFGASVSVLYWSA